MEAAAACNATPTSWEDIAGAWTCVCMFVLDQRNGATPRFPFGKSLCGSITYTKTLVPDVWMVHALIASIDGAPQASELNLGKLYINREWQAPAVAGAPPQSDGSTSAATVVTHYVGTARWADAAPPHTALEHVVIGSPNASYVGRTLVRQVLLSPDGRWMLLRGPLGMDPATTGHILWCRPKLGKL